MWGVGDGLPLCEELPHCTYVARGVLRRGHADGHGNRCQKVGGGRPHHSAHKPHKTVCLVGLASLVGAEMSESISQHVGRHLDGGHVDGCDVHRGTHVVIQYGVDRSCSNNKKIGTVLLAAAATHAGGGPSSTYGADAANSSQGVSSWGTGSRERRSKEQSRVKPTQQEGSNGGDKNTPQLRDIHSNPLGGPAIAG